MSSSSLHLVRINKYLLKPIITEGTLERKIKLDEDRSKSLCIAFPASFLVWGQWHTQRAIWDGFQLRGRLDHLRNKEVDAIVFEILLQPACLLASFLYQMPHLCFWLLLMPFWLRAGAGRLSVEREGGRSQLCATQILLQLRGSALVALKRLWTIHGQLVKLALWQNLFAKTDFFCGPTM